MSPPMAPDLAFLKSEMTATTVITPTTAKHRQWYRQLHLAPIRRVVPLTSQARPEAHKTSSLLLGPLWTNPSTVLRRMQIAACVAWWVRPCCSCVCVCICCRNRRSQYRDHGHHIDPCRTIEWGSNTDPVGSRTACLVWARWKSMRTRGDGSARLRLLLEVRPHALASGLFILRGEGVRAWARPEGSTVKRKLSVSGEGTIVAATSGQRLHYGMSPTGEGGQTQSTPMPLLET